MKDRKSKMLYAIYLLTNCDIKMTLDIATEMMQAGVFSEDISPAYLQGPVKSEPYLSDIAEAQNKQALVNFEFMELIVDQLIHEAKNVGASYSLLIEYKEHLKLRLFVGELNNRLDHHQIVTTLNIMLDFNYIELNTPVTTDFVKTLLNG